MEYIIVSPAEHNLILTLIGRRHGDVGILVDGFGTFNGIVDLFMTFDCC